MRDGYSELYARASKFNTRGATAGARPEAVARAVLKALRARWPKSRYYVGLDAVGLQIAYEWVPTWLLDRIFARVMGAHRRVSDRSMTPTRKPAGAPPMEARTGEGERPASDRPLPRTASG
jgi:hypothetical protein